MNLSGGWDAKDADRGLALAWTGPPPAAPSMTPEPSAALIEVSFVELPRT
jgi:hypothetical protein